MADSMFTASVDSTELLALLDRLGPNVDFIAREVGRDTAKRIVAEAKNRVHRASGVTESGIHWEMTRDGTGYIVQAYTAGHQPDPVDLYNEYGTKFMGAKPNGECATRRERPSSPARGSDSGIPGHGGPLRTRRTNHGHTRITDRRRRRTLGGHVGQMHGC